MMALKQLVGRVKDLVSLCKLTMQANSRISVSVSVSIIRSRGFSSEIIMTSLSTADK